MEVKRCERAEERVRKGEECGQPAEWLGPARIPGLEGRPRPEGKWEGHWSITDFYQL